MKAHRYLLSCLATIPCLSFAQDGIEIMDAHTFVYLMVDEFEITDVPGNNDLSWDADLSVGGDLHKFWMKTEGERSGADADHAEIQVLYSKAILPFWDVQAGVRREIDPIPQRNWAVVSLKGLAPYFFDVEAELFLAEGGQSSFRVRGEYELLLTQRLVLTPEMEIVGYGRDEPDRMIGSGPGRLELNLRLRYEIKRELAPYVGVSWHRLYGGTRDLAKIVGQDDEDARLIVGIRAWF